MTILLWVGALLALALLVYLVVALLGDRVEYGRALVAIEQKRAQRTLLAPPVYLSRAPRIIMNAAARK